MISNAFSTPALLTDQYELTMVEAALHSGTAHRRSVFEVFTRGLPDGRRYGVVGGTSRLLEQISAFSFSDEDLSFLADRRIVNEDTLNYLAEFSFTGDVYGYAEGEAYFPHSPILQIEGTFAEACLLETLVLSVLNHDSAIASAASRMTAVAGPRPCLEMGSRRAHEQAAVAAARAAYIAGFSSTSNLAAGARFGIPTVGTAAHSFTLLHDSEEQAFRAQLETLGVSTTLLVDTYDVDTAVKLAVRLAGPELGAVRLDSGDLIAQARHVRSLLDHLGAQQTRIVVTSDLDEYAIAALAAAPVDAYGVGTSLVTGSGHPTAGLVYKLVSHEGPDGSMVSVAKKSKNKASVGGRKFATRRRNDDGVALNEVIGVGIEVPAEANDRELIHELMREGRRLRAADPYRDVQEAREAYQRSVAELPASWRRLQKGEPVIPTEFITANQR